jgi:hypothetical protein
MTQSREAANSRRHSLANNLMHYKNGTPAKIGDKVLVTPSYGSSFTGIVAEANPGSTACNLQVIPFPANQHHVTASECLRLDEVGDVKAKEPVEATAPES